MLSWFSRGSQPSNQSNGNASSANKAEDEPVNISKPQLRIPKDPKAGAHKLDFKIEPPKPVGADDKIILPSPTKGILVNQDAAKPARKKTVAFDPSTPAADHHKPRPQPRVRSGLPADCPGKFPSPWTPRTSQLDEKTTSNTETNAQTGGSRKDEYRMDDIRRPLFTDKKPDLAPPTTTSEWVLEPVTTRNEPTKKDVKMEDWQIEDLKYQLDGAIAENESMKVKLKEAQRIKKQNERLTRANAAALRHIEEREIELKSYEEAIQKYEADLQQAEQKVYEYEKKARDADDRMNQPSIMFDESGMPGFNPTGATESNGAVRDLKRDLRKTKREAESKERNFQLEIEDLKIQLGDQSSTIDRLRNDKQQLLQELEKLRQDYKETMSSVKMNGDSHARLTQMKLETENARLRRENEQKDRQLENLLRQLDEAKSLGLSLNLSAPVGASSPKAMDFDDDPFFAVGESKQQPNSAPNVLEESFDWAAITGPQQPKPAARSALDFDTMFAPKPANGFNPTKFSPTNREAIEHALKPNSPFKPRRTSPRKSLQSKPTLFAEEGKPITNFDNDNFGWNNNFGANNNDNFSNNNNNNNNNFGFTENFSSNNNKDDFSSNNNDNNQDSMKAPLKPWQKKPAERPAARPAAKPAASNITKSWQKKPTGTTAASKPSTDNVVKPWQKKPVDNTVKPWHRKNTAFNSNINKDNFIPLDDNLGDLLNNNADNFSSNNENNKENFNSNNNRDSFSDNNQNKFSNNNRDNFTSNNDNQNQNQNNFGSNGDPVKPWQKKPTASAPKPWQKKNSAFNNNINQDNFIPLDDNLDNFSNNQNNSNNDNQDRNQNNFGSNDEPIKPWQKKPSANVVKPWQKKNNAFNSINQDNFIPLDDDRGQNNFSTSNDNQRQNNFNSNEEPVKPWQKKPSDPVKPWQKKTNTFSSNNQTNFSSNNHNLHSDNEDADVSMDLATSPPRQPLSPRKSAVNDNIRNPPVRYSPNLKSAVSPRATYIGLLESPRSKPAVRTTAGTRRVSGGIGGTAGAAAANAAGKMRTIDPARRAQAERRLAEKRRLAGRARAV